MLMRSSGSLHSMLSIACKHSYEIPCGGFIFYLGSSIGTAAAADALIDSFLYTTFLGLSKSSSFGGSI